jgi:hypothetical protein
MRSIVFSLAALALLAGTASVATGSAAASQPARTSAHSNCTVSYLASKVTLPHVTVNTAAINATGTFSPPGQPAVTGLPTFCDVTLAQTDRAGNPIHIEVWLPNNWDGRFQGVGGAVFACGPFYNETAPAIQAGYASATSDCGVNPADLLTGSWALTAKGHLDWPLINEFAFRGIHDMTVIGKAVTTAYYPAPLRFSYFNGCSTGGREGLMEAQRYPADYNGISAGAPAINWTKFIPSEIWPELVMKESGDFLPTCKEGAFTESAVRACGSTDGVITNPSACGWNPFSLVGLVTPCGAITVKDAAVMQKIWDGPEAANGKHLWLGLERGASLAGLAATTTTSGVTTGNPFPIPVAWLGTWLQKNPSWNWRTLTYVQFDKLFAQSVAEFGSTIATDNPNLSAFRRDGGKIIIWHGLADQLIFPQGTVNYYQRVQQVMGGSARTDSFARLFLASGTQHCASAAGPAPAPGQPLAALVHWVEHGVAPVTIPGEIIDPATNVVTASRPLCLYPMFARYTGHGSTTQASNYHCAA